MELCVALWVIAILGAAMFTPFPNNIPWWFWIAGMAACAPVTAAIGARRDRDTTMSREMVYFFRPGLALMKLIFWPITIAVACFFDSQRRGYISNVTNELYNVHHRHGMRGDTACEIARGRAESVDRHCDAIGSAATYVAEGAGELSTVACRTTVLAATLTGVAGSVAYGQSSATTLAPAVASVSAAVSQPAPTPMPTTSIFLARTGQNLQAPFTGTYHLAEFLQIRGKWLLPDMGYVDFATNNYREFFGGGGWTFVNGKRATLTGEGFFVQDTGPAAHSARYLWGNPILNVRFTPKFTWQTGYLSYIPLNRAGTFQQVLERSKLEYAFTKSVKAGGGYAAYEKVGKPVQNKPFGTVTFSTHAGSLELWCQHVPRGAQVQARYVFAHTAAH